MMRRPAKATALDSGGETWEVAEARATRHGFDVLLGRPSGGGRQGVTVICTPELAAYLEARRYPARGVDLPIGITAVKRLRKALEQDWYDDHTAWWEERIADVCDLTLEAFAARHEITVGAAEAGRLRLLGKTLRPSGWWRTGEAAALLLGDMPARTVAERLEISTGGVRRLRWALRRGADSPQK